MKVEKLAVPVEEQAEQEYAASLAARSKAVDDYNIMMGNLEDPSEDDEEMEVE